MYVSNLGYLFQDLVTFIHQQSIINERQLTLNEEQSMTIEKQSALIQHLQKETRVSLRWIEKVYFNTVRQYWLVVHVRNMLI